MSFARVLSAQSVYLDASLITVEADLSKGLHAFQIVGLADKAVDEARERVSAAIKNSGYGSPQHSNKRIIISLAPADLKKEGPRFDLPIALSYLLAAGEIVFNTSGIVFLGELSLEGALRPVRGVLSITKAAQERGIHTIVVPTQNAHEAALIHDITVIAASTLTDVIAHFDQSGTKPPRTIAPQPPTEQGSDGPTIELDLSDIRGQETAKRGLEIAAAGRHNILLYGPPGTGKTLLARALAGILPPLTREEALEATAIHSIAGTLTELIMSTPPFRAPHHSASYASIVGGGSIPRPGEVTLAHRGVLFLDEFPEFERRVIDGLREPLEERIVSVSRARGSVSFPANFILVAAMNPNREREPGRISELDKIHLKKKLSGPIVDRIDLWIEVTHIDHELLSAPIAAHTETSAQVRDRVSGARTRQHTRYGSSTRTNSDMRVRDIDHFAFLDDRATSTLKQAALKLRFSPRTYHRTIKLARTIADLAGSDQIQEPHMLEALTYRPKGLFE